MLPRSLGRTLILLGPLLFFQGFGLGGVIASFGLALDLIGFVLFLVFVLVSSVILLTRKRGPQPLGQTQGIQVSNTARSRTEDPRRPVPGREAGLRHAPVEDVRIVVKNCAGGLRWVLVDPWPDPTPGRSPIARGEYTVMLWYLLLSSPRSMYDGRARRVGVVVDSAIILTSDELRTLGLRKGPSSQHGGYAGRDY